MKIVHPDDRAIQQQWQKRGNRIFGFFIFSTGFLALTLIFAASYGTLQEPSELLTILLSVVAVLFVASLLILVATIVIGMYKLGKLCYLIVPDGFMSWRDVLAVRYNLRSKPMTVAQFDELQSLMDAGLVEELLNPEHLDEEAYHKLNIEIQQRLIRSLRST